MTLRVFGFPDALLVARRTSRSQLRLQLAQWVDQGKMLRLRRGVYCFPEHPPSPTEIARALYAPSYVSLEYALSHYGLLPDVPFVVTCVTTRPTRVFETPLGAFHYHTIRDCYFTGYDVRTGMAGVEKALLDYMYFHASELKPDVVCWEMLRLQHLSALSVIKLRSLSKIFKSPKMGSLTKSVINYARSKKSN